MLKLIELFTMQYKMSKKFRNLCRQSFGIEKRSGIGMTHSDITLILDKLNPVCTKLDMKRFFSTIYVSAKVLRGLSMRTCLSGHWFRHMFPCVGPQRCFYEVS